MKRELAVAALILVAIYRYARRARSSRNDAPSSSQVRGSPTTASEDTVVLCIAKTSDESEGVRCFELIYADESGSTRFALELGATSSGDESPFSMGDGALLRRAGSDPAPLLCALARLHGEPWRQRRAKANLDRLELTAAVLATNASVTTSMRSIAGRYAKDPPGPWLVLKLFIPTSPEEDADQGEIFLALDERDGTAEFSVKDGEEWPEVARGLMSVLLLSSN